MSTEKSGETTHLATLDLWRIAETGETEPLESILAAGADINATNSHGMTALMRAAAHGRIEMVCALLEHGADPNTSRSDRFTPLMLAAFFGHEEIVKILVGHGADIEAATRSETSARMWASARTYDELAHYLKKPRSDRELSMDFARSTGIRGAERHDAHADEVSALNNERRQAMERLLAIPDGFAELRSLAPDQSRGELMDAGDFDPSLTVDSAFLRPYAEEVPEALEYFVPRSRYTSRRRHTNQRILLYAITNLLLVLAVIAAMTLGWKQRVSEMPSQGKPNIALDGGVVGIGSAVGSPDEAPPETQPDKLEFANDATSHFRRLDDTGNPPQDASKAQYMTKGPIAVPVFVSPDAARRNRYEPDLVVTSVAAPTLPAEEARTPESDGAAASGPTSPPSGASAKKSQEPAANKKPEPAASRSAAPLQRPPAQTTQLINGARNATSNSKVIQWP